MIVKFEGTPHNFPDDATPDEIAAALDALAPAAPSTIVPASGTMPAANRASQADVRASEPAAIPDGRGDTVPMAAQRESQRQFDAAFKRWTAAGGTHASRAAGLALTNDAGQPKNDRQLVAEWSGLTDPVSTIDRAEQEHLAQGGDIGDVYGDSVPYVGAKVGAAMLGAAGGPIGSAAAEIVPRLAAVTFAVNKGVQSGALNADEAAMIVLKEVSKGFVTDAAFNIGVPALSKLIGAVGLKLPGGKWLVDRAEQIATKAVQRATAGLPVSAPAVTPAVREPLEEWLKNKPTDTPRELKAKARARLVPDNPKRQKAIRNLSERLPDDKMMTPGSVTDEPGAWESNVRKSRPIELARMDKAVEGSADEMLRAGINPESQMGREDLGRTILSTAEKTQEATKKRLAPVFERADNLGVKVDLSEAAGFAKKALAADASTPGGTLKETERKALNDLLAFVKPDPIMPRSRGATSDSYLVTPAAALDFVSARKAALRATVADGKPSEPFSRLTGQIVNSAENSYQQAARASGQGDVAKDLLRAQHDYRTTMETVYEDAIKNALKKNPEDVGKYLWGAGNVGEIRQLHRLLGLAQKEGVVGRSGAEKVRLDVARGWLQEAVPNLDAAANWSQMLKENPAKRDTWNILSAGPNGIALNDTMKVIEQAAQMAVKKNMMPAGEIAVISRASKGSLGQSFYSGDVNVPLWVAGINLTQITKAAATAYSHGDRGTLNGIMQVLRARNAGTPAAAKGAQAAYEKLKEFAKENDIGDLEAPEAEQK